MGDQARRRVRRIRRSMRRRRTLRRAQAFAGGYFWLPCPRCGDDFGGHEWVGRHTITTSIQTDAEGNVISEMSTGVCPACEADIDAMGEWVCRRAGHDWGARWQGRQQEISRDGQGRITAAFTFDEPEVRCVNCGALAPADVAASVIDGLQ